MVKRGEVWWGSTAGKRRPFLILTRDAAVPLLSKVVVAPMTTTIRHIPSEVLLDRRDGMPQPCVVALDGVTTVQKGSLRRRITTLGASRLDEICEALVYTLGCRL